MQDQDDSGGEIADGDAPQIADDRNASGDVLATVVQRRGDVEKCPVCGSAVDAEAYYCPTCRNYFCYQCRARLLVSEKHCQCVNPSCQYYGKLVCSVCNELAEKEEAPSVYVEPEDGYWPAWLALVLVVSALSWYWFSFLVAVAVGVLLYGLGGYLLHRCGLNIFGSTRMVEQQRRSTYHTCVCCRQPVKEVIETR